MVSTEPRRTSFVSQRMRLRQIVELILNIVFLADLSWSDAKDDALFKKIGQTTITEINKYAASINKANEYIYLDYADGSQNPLRGYGAANLRKLREVARKYDSEAVFQTLVPGGFKLDAASPA